MLITRRMDDLADLLRPGTSRPVVTDPAKVSVLPCVLVEPPTLSTDEEALCGASRAQFTVLVIGMPGARAELGALAELLEEILIALEESGLGWQRAEPVGYTPLTVSGQADVCQTYRITIEGVMA